MLRTCGSSIRFVAMLRGVACLFATLASLAAAQPARAGADMFGISLNQVVSSGNPGPGAGNIEGNGEVDVYTFTAPPNQVVFFNEITTTSCSINWSLKDGTRQTLFSEQFGQCGPDAGVLTLAGGTYTLTVQILSGVGSGTYAFNLVTPDSADEFAIGLDQVVSNENPAAGAGNIEYGGAVDIYTFSLDGESEVFFNEITTTTCNLTWTLLDPSAAVIFSQQFGQCGPDAGAFVLARGTYTLRVEDLAGNSTGTYALVLNSSASEDLFGIALNQVVSNGVPAAGAGNIDFPGNTDIYTFEAAPGTEVFFNEVTTINCNFIWTLTDPQGAVIFSQQFGQCGPDAGTFVLAGGTYTVHVADSFGNGSGPYAFVLITTDSHQHFSLNLDQPVSNGVPAAGAGNIEFPGAVDIYTVNVPDGTEVFFNEVSTNNCAFNWTVTDPSNAVVFSQQLGQCGPDFGTLVLSGGTYTVRVEEPSGNSTGVYSFNLVTSNSHQHFDIGYGIPVSNGFPGVGAGNLETPGSVDFYSLSAAEGDEVFFNEITTQSCNFIWTLTDPQGATIFSEQLGQCGPDAGTFVLGAGVHTIRVEDPSGNVTGTYAFAVCSVHSPDINCDGHVNAADLAILLASWGSSGPMADLNLDGTVSAADLAVLLASWTG